MNEKQLKILHKPKHAGMICLSLWRSKHQTVGNMINYRPFSPLWHSLRFLISVMWIVCLTLSQHSLCTPASLCWCFFCIVSFLSGSVGWTVPPLTLDLLISCQLQWGLQGALFECVGMHVWMCVCDRGNRNGLCNLPCRRVCSVYLYDKITSNPHIWMTEWED